MSAADQPERDQPPSCCQPDCSAGVVAAGRNKTNAGQRNGETASSSPESGSLNGDGKRTGKSRRRKKRSSNSEGKPDSKGDAVAKNDEKAAQTVGPPADPRAALQSECANVWFERSRYERAESLYHCWLASSANGTAKPNGSPPAPVKTSKSTPATAPPFSGPSCHHGNQVACHHVVRDVWVNKATFDQAEHRFESTQPPVPNSLQIPTPSSASNAARTPDDGYQSLTPTPVTPVVAPAARQSINGLPRVPMELLRGVWLDKPLYDRAEAAFYQNLYGNNSTKRSSGASASRSNDHPQSLVEEDEGEEEEAKAEEKRVVAPQGKVEAFHALHPIQEEEEPSEAAEKEDRKSGHRYFLHPDSERVWLDKWRYDAAESCFHGYRSGQAVAAVKKGRRPEAGASSVGSAATLRDKNMSALDFLSQEKIWFDKPRYDDAERRFYEKLNGSTTQNVGSNTILQDIARARENIQKSLAGSTSSSSPADEGEIISRIKSLELENNSLHKVVEDLRAALSKLECRVAVLEKSPAAVTPAPAPSVPYTNGTSVQKKTSVPVKQQQEEEEEEDDDVDLFGSDEDEEAERIKEERLKAYAEKKAKKPGIIAKSSILLDVKPWDDETDMVKLEECVRSVQADGLLWGSSKLLPVGYGIKKLQIACVVEDDKVGTDLLEEEITKFEEFIQSVDVAAFNKI